MNRKQLARLEQFLAQCESEKIVLNVSVKMPHSLAEALKLVAGRSGVSRFIRETLTEKLVKMVEVDD